MCETGVVWWTALPHGSSAGLLVPPLAPRPDNNICVVGVGLPLWTPTPLPRRWRIRGDPEAGEGDLRCEGETGNDQEMTGVVSHLTHTSKTLSPTAGGLDRDGEGREKLRRGEGDRPWGREGPGPIFRP